MRVAARGHARKAPTPQRPSGTEALLRLSCTVATFKSSAQRRECAGRRELPDLFRSLSEQTARCPIIPRWCRNLNKALWATCVHSFGRRGLAGCRGVPSERCPLFVPSYSSSNLFRPNSMREGTATGPACLVMPRVTWTGMLAPRLVTDLCDEACHH